MGTFRNWCRPTTSSARLARPNTPAPHAPMDRSQWPKPSSAPPIGGQTHRHSAANTIATNAMMIGTSRLPLKKPSQSTSRVRWNRAQKKAASSPRTMPPNTPGFWKVNGVTDPTPAPTLTWQPTCGIVLDPPGHASGNWCSTP